jgi:polyisoprenoid-binding protein YceI
MTSTTATTGTLPLAPGRWTLDAAHSSVAFAIRHLGISKVRGVFHGIDVTVDVGETAAATSVAALVDLATIDTGNADRDAHVLASDLLDVAKRPQMRFQSTAISGTGADWRLDGELTIGDVTRPLHLDVELGGLETYPIDGSTHAGFEAVGVIDRHDFGLDFGLLDAALGRRIQISLDIQLREPDPSAGGPAVSPPPAVLV